MEIPMITAIGFILFGLICIYLFNKKTLPKNKTYWVPKMEPMMPMPQLKTQEERRKELIDYMEDGRLSMQYGSKELGIVANKIEQEYPYLKETIDQLRELQGCLYLMNQFFKQGNHTLDEIRDYETYLMRKFYITHHQLLDIPTNNRQKI